MNPDTKRIVEALLFVAEQPLGLDQLCRVLESVERVEVRAALEELTAEYQALGRSFELVEVAGGWCFRTRPELAFWLRRLRKQQVTRLSRAALETLAVVAYKQPVLKAEIERIRGVEVGGILRTLMEKGLIKVAGRKDLPGKPLIYATTRRFLEVFDLHDLGDLPSLEELEALNEGLDAGQPELAFGPLDEDEADAGETAAWQDDQADRGEDLDEPLDRGPDKPQVA